jgi:DNA-binding response OmpR family regulator
MATTRHSDTSTKALNGLHVLLVEERTETRGQMKQALEHHGAFVTARETAARALVAMETVKPSVLVVGLETSDENAYWLIRNVREAARNRGVLPAIALMPRQSDATAERILAEGFHTQLQQPVHIGELCDAIVRVVR